MGQLLHSNPQLAMKYYLLGADAGSAMGTRNLGYHFLHGNACEQNWRKAAQYLQKARKMGEPRVNFDLAHLYENGIGGIEHDPKEAVRLLILGLMNTVRLLVMEVC